MNRIISRGRVFGSPGRSSISYIKPIQLLGTIATSDTGKRDRITSISRNIRITQYHSTSPVATETNDQCICGLLKCLQGSCPSLKAGEWGQGIPEDRNLAPYLGSDWASIDYMLGIAELKPGFRLLDLGAGDGRVLIRAIHRGCSYAEGWELNKDVYEMAKLHIDAVLDTGVDNSIDNNIDSKPKCNIIFGDVIDSDPSQFDIVTLFLLPGGLQSIQSWLNEQVIHFENISSDNNDQNNNNNCTDFRYLKFVTQGWEMPGWKHLRRFVSPTGGTLIYLYVFRRALKI